MDSEPEIWRQVPNHDLLEASSWGRVRSKEYSQAMPYGGTRTRQLAATAGALVAGQKGAKYQRHIVLFKRKTYKVARLVCLAFHGAPPEGRNYALHEDENSSNNTPGNLRWGTQKENLNAPGFIAHFRGRTGENSNTAKARRAREGTTP